MDLKEKAKALPESPGVYLMKDFSGSIIYVGKSKNLRSRVSQYFQRSKNHPPKVVKMVQGIRDFDYITTDTEFEALLLECRLIKRIKPMYNSQMKNDKKYVYIKITINEEYPRILVAKEELEDGGLYFGPYTSLKSIEKAVAAIRDNYQVGNCSGADISKSGAGCLNYQMGLCLGVCADPGLKVEYVKRVKDIIAFLNGKDNSIIDIIEAKMRESAQKLDFSKAAKYRDDVYSLKHILNKQRVIKFSQKTRNIAAIEPINETDIKIFLLYDSRLLHDEKVDMGDMSMESFKNHLKKIIIEHFKPNIGNEIRKIDKDDIDEAQIIFSYLKNSRNCMYSLIPAAWLNEKSWEKLDKGIDKLLRKFPEKNKP